MLFVRWWRTERFLLFLPHPGIGPSQPAEGVWPRERVWLEGGSDVKGEELWSVFRREACSKERKKEKLGEKRISVWKNSRVLEACSESLRSEKRRLRKKG